MKEFYRYYMQVYASNDGWGPSTVQIQLMKFYLVKETPKGYWISYEGGVAYLKNDKWVSKTSRKRFAYPTKEEALRAFIMRTERRQLILETQLSDCKRAIHLAKTMTI